MKEIVTTLLKAVIVLALLTGIIISLAMVYSSFDVVSPGQHVRFFASKKYFHDNVTNLCFMVLTDSFGRGITLVPCDRIPPDLLIHLHPETHK